MEKKVIWTCPECGREHIQEGASDLYCVCGDGQVALSSDEWEELHYVRKDRVEVLAHRLWTHWSQHIAEEEDISGERLDRWKDLWIPFEDLSEEIQEKDRELVDRFLDEKPDYKIGGSRHG